MFGALVYGMYHFELVGFKDEKFSYHNFDSFETLDREFWYVGEWETFFPAYNKVIMKDGTVAMTVNESERGPFMLSKPILIETESVITIKRKVYVDYGNERFTGGFALMQTDSQELRPMTLEESEAPLGAGIALIEYVHNYNESSKRPGRDVFRVLAPNWERDRNFVLMEPIFGEWFEEEVIYNTSNGNITYKVNEQGYKLKGLAMDEKSPYLRLFMHAYGEQTGHTHKMDSFELKIEGIN